MGWFFGFKLHLIIICADKGYIGQALFDDLFLDGIQLVTKVKNSMTLMSIADKILLRKRALIETANDGLKNIAQTGHSILRSFNNFIADSLPASWHAVSLKRNPPLISASLRTANLNTSNLISNSRYIKRFCRLWLDAVLPNFPAAQNFRGRIQTQTINEFYELDKGQFKIAQARVREHALSRMPDFNSINGAENEIGKLKKELNKQRRLMPLRKLFMEISNLVTSLRPCFIMGQTMALFGKALPDKRALI